MVRCSPVAVGCRSTGIRCRLVLSTRRLIEVMPVRSVRLILVMPIYSEPVRFILIMPFDFVTVRFIRVMPVYSVSVRFVGTMPRAFSVAFTFELINRSFTLHFKLTAMMSARSRAESSVSAMPPVTS